MPRSGELLKGRLEELRISQRAFQKIIGKNYTTIGRYISGAVPIPTAVADAIANKIFKNPSAKKDFLRRCRDEYADRTQAARSERERKRLRGKIAKSFYCEVRFDTFNLLETMGFPKTADFSNDFLKPDEEELDPDRFAHAYSPGDLYHFGGAVSVFEREDPVDIKILTIYQGWIFFHPLRRDQWPKMTKESLANERIMGFGSAEETILRYKQFCIQKKISKHGILDLAKEAIENSDLMKSINYRDGMRVLVNVALIKKWMGELKLIGERLNAKSSLSRAAKIKGFKGVAAIIDDLRMLKKQPQAADECRSRLLAMIDYFRKQIS
jgi:hypothetical protein